VPSGPMKYQLITLLPSPSPATLTRNSLKGKMGADFLRKFQQSLNGGKGHNAPPPADGGTCFVWPTVDEVRTSTRGYSMGASIPGRLGMSISLSHTLSLALSPSLSLCLSLPLALSPSLARTFSASLSLPLILALSLPVSLMLSLSVSLALSLSFSLSHTHVYTHTRTHTHTHTHTHAQQTCGKAMPRRCCSLFTAAFLLLLQMCVPPLKRIRGAGGAPCHTSSKSVCA